MSKKKAEFELTIKIKYDLNGEQAETLKGYLRELPLTMAGNGDFTGMTDATVDEWAFKVKKV